LHRDYNLGNKNDGDRGGCGEKVIERGGEEI
jgi:hypothetical protein